MDVSRREFVHFCTMAAAAVGLGPLAAERFVEAAIRGEKPSVIWLQFQECTGCTESLLRTAHPAIDSLILDLISLDYHETLFAAAGHQAEAALEQAMRAHDGKYVCIVEGAIPLRDRGVYCMIGGRTAIDILQDVGGHAGAVIAIGSCASWGGVPSAGPNPTGSAGVDAVLNGKPIVNIPGCPANPYNLLGTVLQYATYGTLPALDAKGRPKFAYGQTIHEHCPRRAHFDAGRFADRFGDEGHKQGWCLYKIGCKGPATYANCSVQHFCEIENAWPIGLGAPCFGCTEQQIGFTVPAFQTIEIRRPMPPDTYPAVLQPQGRVSPIATGVAGAVMGGLVGAGLVAAKKFNDRREGSSDDEARHHSDGE